VEQGLWYLAYENQEAMGPYPESEVAGGLASGRFLPSAKACPLGEATWRSVREIPTFLAATGLATVMADGPRDDLSDGSRACSIPVEAAGKNRPFLGVLLLIGLAAFIIAAVAVGSAFFRLRTTREQNRRAAADHLQRCEQLRKEREFGWASIACSRAESLDPEGAVGARAKAMGDTVVAAERRQEAERKVRLAVEEFKRGTEPDLSEFANDERDLYRIAALGVQQERKKELAGVRYFRLENADLACRAQSIGKRGYLLSGLNAKARSQAASYGKCRPMVAANGEGRTLACCPDSRLEDLLVEGI